MTTDHNYYSTSSDKNLVLIAKNTLVWLYQLSEKYRKPICNLDQIPMVELEQLASWGINGLWLVGVWERSPASRKIKQFYGNDDPVASAYSIQSYEIAQNLGGRKSFDVLKKEAQQAGIELACDMVPNHTGLDAPWLINHPDWYISTQNNPKEEWRFNSPNLLDDEKREIQLEEGYYTKTGAAEVFRYRDGVSHQDMYIYHGNDGTSMPWNDTAQLNYLKSQVRRAVRQQIIDISHIFRIIRLDAAMTLTRKHFRRLWFPAPGELKCIPSREQFSLSQKEFDRLMPDEFWLDVMKDITCLSPNTLFLAEAFWLMERYFIEDLGIHRVYNSTFMHHLQDGNNKALRHYLIEILNHNPLILERFVNFLTTPDEKSAADVFGKSARYFGSCALMASLPGLPLFGHGQFEGLVERYGMDMKKPSLPENIDVDMIHDHTRLITPLLLQRERFSSAKRLVLFDFLLKNHDINENVFVFCNSFAGQKSMVLFNNHVNPASGVVGCARCHLEEFEHIDNPLHHILAALEIPINEKKFLILKNIQTNDTLDIPMCQIEKQGLEFELPGYSFVAFDVSCR